MRSTLGSLLLGALVVTTIGAACKKENKASTTDKATVAVDKAAAVTKDGVAGAVAAAEQATEAAGQATEAAGQAAAAAGEAAEAAGEAAAAIIPDGDPGPRPAKVTDADLVVMEKTVEVLQKVDAVVAAAGNDCRKVAEAIKSVSSEGERLMNEGRQIVARYGDDEAPAQWINTTYGKRILPAIVRLNSNPCTKETDVQAALAPFSF